MGRLRGGFECGLGRGRLEGEFLFFLSQDLIFEAFFFLLLSSTDTKSQQHLLQSLRITLPRNGRNFAYQKHPHHHALRRITHRQHLLRQSKPHSNFLLHLPQPPQSAHRPRTHDPPLVQRHPHALPNRNSRRTLPFQQSQTSLRNLPRARLARRKNQSHPGNRRSTLQQHVFHVFRNAARRNPPQSHLYEPDRRSRRNRARSSYD